MTQQKGKIFYGYAIMVSCIIMLIVGTGIIVNTVNQFVLPITEQTGMSRAAFTLYTSFQNIALMLTVPFLSKIYSKIKPKLMTIIGFVVMCAAYCLLSQCTQAWQFYVCGVFIGFGLAFVSTTTVGVLINNWFIKNKGTVMGIAMAGSGFGSMIFNPVGQQLIAAYGYQTAYLILAAIIFVVFIPVMIVYRFKPEDMGLKPLGYVETQTADGTASGEVTRTGMTYKEAIRSPKFYLLAFIVLCPEHAATIAKDFPDQRAARDFMRETAAMPYKFYSQETCVPGKDFGPYDENTFIPRFKKTESIKFFVSGGPGKQSQIWVPFPQVFKPVSKKIAE